MTNEVLNISKRIWQASQERNVDELKVLIHKDALFVHMGVTLTRDQEIEVIEKQSIVYKHIAFEEIKVQPIDTMIIVLTKLKLTAVVSGNEVINPFVVTETYTTTNNEIKLASLSYTRINY